MMDDDKGEGLPEEVIPFHAALVGSSRVEMLDHGVVRYDPETAHSRAGDPGYEKRLPGTCGLCRATALAEEAQAQEVEKERLADGR